MVRMRALTETQKNGRPGLIVNPKSVGNGKPVMPFPAPTVPDAGELFERVGQRQSDESDVQLPDPTSPEKEKCPDEEPGRDAGTGARRQKLEQRRDVLLRRKKTCGVCADTEEHRLTKREDAGDAPGEIAGDCDYRQR